MGKEYDGRIDNIDLPCPLLLEVVRSVLVETNSVGRLESEAEYSGGSKIYLSVDLFEKHIGDDEPDMPVVKYSTEPTAPAVCGKLRLRTPNYYRGLEAGAPGLSDPFEGCRFSHRFGPGSEMVMTPEDGSGRSFVFDASGATKIDLCTKTFMYCTSAHSGSNLLSRESAKALFAQDYTHGSVFQSSKQLALRILHGYAATVARGMLDAFDPEYEESFAEAYAWIVHGPVEYLPEGDMKTEGVESYFTKPDSYRDQKEYRFWIGFRNTPSQKDEAKLSLPIPEGIAAPIALE